MRNLFMPPNYYVGDDFLIFLIGPILGAPLWQKEAYDILREGTDKPIASPRQIIPPYRDFHPQVDSRKQIEWETAHLSRSGKKGLAMVWLPLPEFITTGRDYARTSRTELGEHLANHKHTGSHIVVGIQEGFQGKDYLLERIRDTYSDVPVFSTLRETCTKTIEIISSSPHFP